MKVLVTQIRFFGQICAVTCDHRCDKAWGHNGRRYHEADAAMLEFDENDPDDIAYLPDDEVGRAPDNPGTYEGGDGKPLFPDIHNKWCVRECERSDTIGVGEEMTVLDFSVRQYNICDIHDDALPQRISMGEIFKPELPFERKSWWEEIEK